MLTYDIRERARRAAIMSAVTQPQGNKTQPPGRKNVTLEKSSWRAAGQWYGAGEVNFSLGCVLSPGFILYVFSSYKFCMWFCHTSGYSNCRALHIRYTVPIYMRISTVIRSACASSCGVWLAQWSVRMNAHRARAGSNPSAVHDRHFSCLY